MHNLLEAACRRSAGIAAGVILTGGLAGGVLLTPAAAYATTAVPTSTAVTATQTPTFHGTTLTVDVSVSNEGNTTNGTPTGSVQVTGAGTGCTVNSLNSAGAG